MSKSRLTHEEIIDKAGRQIASIRRQGKEPEFVIFSISVFNTLLDSFYVYSHFDALRTEFRGIPLATLRDHEKEIVRVTAKPE